MIPSPFGNVILLNLIPNLRSRWIWIGPPIRGELKQHDQSCFCDYCWDVICFEYIWLCGMLGTRCTRFSPQSGLPRIRTRDLKVFWFALLVPSALVAQICSIFYFKITLAFGSCFQAQLAGLFGLKASWKAFIEHMEHIKFLCFRCGLGNETIRGKHCL